MALDSGKTIVVFLNDFEEVSVRAQTPELARHGSVYYNTLSFLPIDLGRIVPKGGSNIQTTDNIGVLQSYWKEFREYSYYTLYFDNPDIVPALVTNTGKKSIGAVIKVRQGHLVLLPPLSFDDERFTYYNEATGEEGWTDEAVAAGRRLINHIGTIDHALRAGRNATPPPTWSEEPAYEVAEESSLSRQIADLERVIEEKQSTLNKLSADLAEAGWLRRLLYETGPRLEGAILKALNVLGFTATGFDNAESEFDAVFTSPEGRFLGEAEGKNNKAINIDKLSQLERNIQEDYMRDEVSEYPKGVLFGNAFRLTDPDERDEFFTPKCLSGAKRSGVALVRTTDLFISARYLVEHPDPDYAEACRVAIAKTEGEIVDCPKPPA